MSDQLATPTSLIEQLRSWFHPKDRAVVIPNIVTAIPLSSGSTLAWCLISETVLTASVASVTLSNIPQNFRSLVLIANARTDRVSTSDVIYWQANADAGANYDLVDIYGNTAAASSTNGIGTAFGRIVVCDAASSRANCFGGALAIFPNYRDTTLEKQSWSIGGNTGTPSAATIFMEVCKSCWRSTVAISSLTLFPQTGPNFVAKSIFQLYGVL